MENSIDDENTTKQDSIIPNNEDDTFLKSVVKSENLDESSACDRTAHNNGLYRADGSHSPISRPFTNFCIDNILKSNFGNVDNKIIKTPITKIRSDVKYNDEREDDFESREVTLYPGGYISDKLSSESLVRTNRYYRNRQRPADLSSSFLRGDGTNVENRDSRLALDLSRKGTSSKVQKYPDKKLEQSRKLNSFGSQVDAESKKILWPAWVFCTRYSDRPSSGPRIRKHKTNKCPIEKRPRTAFSKGQLDRLKIAFDGNQYLTEETRIRLSDELNLSPSQIKIWFQNKRAKLKKCNGYKNSLAVELYAQGLYNHRTMSK